MKKVNWGNVLIIFAIGAVFLAIGAFIMLNKVNEALAYRGIVIEFELSLNQLISVMQK